MVGSASAARTSWIATSRVIALDGLPPVLPCGRSASADTFRPTRSCAAARWTARVSTLCAIWTERDERVFAMVTSARHTSVAVRSRSVRLPRIARSGATASR